MSKGARMAGSACVVAGLAAASYPILYRSRCLTWGATPDEVAMNLPGDELLPAAELVTTRAIGISAPPASIWPWLAQMGSGRGGTYTYDWVENLLGLDVHSANEILPRFQDVRLGDEFPIGPKRGIMRVAVLDPGRVIAASFQDGSCVRIFALVPYLEPDGVAEAMGATRLISRTRMNLPVRWRPARAIYSLLFEPGNLVMERKMLTGIKERAERLEQTREIPIVMQG